MSLLDYADRFYVKLLTFNDSVVGLTAYDNFFFLFFFFTTNSMHLFEKTQTEFIIQPVQVTVRPVSTHFNITFHFIPFEIVKSLFFSIYLACFREK